MSTIQLEKVKPGEIWWVQLSFNTIGHETKKTRPCIIIANNPQAKMMTIIPLQSNLGAKRLLFTHLIRKNKLNRLKNDSIAVIFQMRSLSYKRFLTFSSKIDNRDLRNIKIIIKEYLEI